MKVVGLMLLFVGMIATASAVNVPEIDAGCEFAVSMRDCG
jgi:hypothetical protein